MVTNAHVLLAGAAMLLTMDGALSANPRPLSGVVQTGGTSTPDATGNLIETHEHAADFKES